MILENVFVSFVSPALCVCLANSDTCLDRFVTVPVSSLNSRHEHFSKKFAITSQLFKNFETSLLHMNEIHPASQYHETESHRMASNTVVTWYKVHHTNLYPTVKLQMVLLHHLKNYAHTPSILSDKWWFIFVWWTLCIISSNKTSCVQKTYAKSLMFTMGPLWQPLIVATESIHIVKFHWMVLFYC